MIDIELPNGWSNPRIVLGYNNEIRLMVSLTDEIIKAWNDSGYDIMREKKIELLEKALGYKIEKMENIIKHDDYEKLWADEIERMKNKK